jgi:ribosomal protein L11 methyltransferase
MAFLFLSKIYTIMDYYKITIEITPFEEWLRDVLVAQLAEIGFDSFIETSTGTEAFIQVNSFIEADFQFVLDSFQDYFSFSTKKELIKSQNWNEEWEKNYFKPLVINNECVIRAPFHTDFSKAKYEIIIEPNMAFGTGNHETTSMMVETILENNMKNKNVLDMGCGTGILGILASMKGAKKVTAIDIDEWSFNGSNENAALNNIGNITVKQGDADLLGSEKFDIILANIHKNVLLTDMAAYTKVLNQGGLLVMSGFYTEDKQDIKLKAESLGLKDNGFKIKNNWVAYIFRQN